MTTMAFGLGKPSPGQPDQTAPIGAVRSGSATVCRDQSVQILFFMVFGDYFLIYLLHVADVIYRKKIRLSKNDRME